MPDYYRRSLLCVYLCRDPGSFAVSFHHLGGNRHFGLPGCGASHQQRLHHRGHHHAHHLWLCSVGQYHVSRISVATGQEFSCIGVYEEPLLLFSKAWPSLFISPDTATVTGVWVRRATGTVTRMGTHPVTSVMET